MAADREVEGAIRARVAARLTEWFPEAPDRAPVQVRLLSDRRRSRLYAVHVGDGEAPRLVAKVRIAGPGRVDRRQSGRPTLGGGPLPERQLTRLEYDGLATIHSAFAAAGPEFGTVRPLDLIAEHDVLLMEHVPGRSLRDLLVSGSRLVPFARGDADLDAELWHRVGSWLGTYQASVAHHGLPARQATAPLVTDHFLTLRDYAASRGGPAAFVQLADRGAELAAATLPGALPLAVGHGDFAPRNVMVSAGPRVVVLDPLPRWAVPAYEDLCRLLVGVRLLGAQLHSRGLAFDQRQVELWETEAARGYFGGNPAVAEMRVYQLLILLDKWSALLDAAPGAKGRMRHAAIRAAGGYISAQGRRLLELALS